MSDSPTPMSPALWDGRNLSTLLPLQDLGGDRYASRASDGNVNQRLYGGQLLGQALLAATQTVAPERRVHMLQATFLRGATIDHPTTLQVQRLLDGSRYSSRHVRVSQGEQAVLDAQVSFQVAQDSPLHRQIDADPVPDPDALTDMVDLVRNSPQKFVLGTVPLIEKHCVEMRPVAPEDFLFVANTQPRLRFWLKLREPLPDTPALHDAAVAYLSDYFITFCSYGLYTPMVGMRDYYVASLNHGLWFHESPRGDDWLLFDCESPATGHRRGFAVVKIFDRARRLVASATQQCTLGERQ
ncbi:acyl-CoA thioesterase II [Hydrocarboniphaga sp.]|uniref:acyl-CoA thioesterase n=1 Tax=Hydrocarboniphaga sp. TaxID=2033016 RepID=UPI00262CA2EF|nr:acyl-CoA thioesterase domain-containing protein [Hydrocarboniphaga sp.]